ncbi:hypothetical protein O7600_21865 [Micromonospora sp. WMMA1998]|uniref:hypothetical protein n=1 Tax=Micromonospora sp. WMMA1998 TaxID=3015167 RepID=UPI00248CD431|nr:hypothetical protein [Micromonospora sp. WMMA1998]WBC13754.1 hypothetical protein O7600_21865 [Micromonospora sp. WMMA1998]
MGQWIRPGRVGILVATILAVAGCGADDFPSTPEPGVAARKVAVIRGDQTYPMTAEVIDWETGPHPQVPERGMAVHFTYRFRSTSSDPWATPTRVELQACAVDGRRVVILCTSIFNDSLKDCWLGPSADPDLARTADVLILPYQMYAGLHAGDPKDHDGYVPPRHLGPGDQL